MQYKYGPHIVPPRSGAVMLSLSSFSFLLVNIKLCIKKLRTKWPIFQWKNVCEERIKKEEEKSTKYNLWRITEKKIVNFEVNRNSIELFITYCIRLWHQYIYMVLTYKIYCCLFENVLKYIIMTANLFFVINFQYS